MGSQHVAQRLSSVSIVDSRVLRLRRLSICIRRAMRTGMLIAVALTGTTATSSASTVLNGDNGSEIDEITYDKARRARVDGDFASAVAMLERLLSDNPDDVDALVQFGFAQLALEDTISAEKAFTKTLSLAPGYTDATLGLAYVAFRRSEFERAERLAVSVLEAEPGYEGARNLLEAAKAARDQTLSIAGTFPPPTLREFPQANGSAVGRDVVAPELEMTPRPERRRAFLSIGSRVGGRREFDLSHALEIRKDAGATLVFGLRHTSRAYGDANLLRFSAFKAIGEVVYGMEIGVGQGADNLARALIGGSVEFPVAEHVAFYSRVRLEKFAQSEVASMASRLTKTVSSGGSFSLGLTSSVASNADGLAIVVDARAALPLSHRTTLRLGVAYGEELNGPAMRDLRSVAIGFAHEINDGLTITGTVESEPGNRRIGLAFARRF